MGNTLAKSPQEYALATAQSTEKQRQLILQPAPSPPPPPGYVRIHFHTDLYRIYDHAPPDMVADIPLCRSGGLDLEVVKQQWGLETCLPVDPLRWKPFQPTHSDYLSAVAVQVLSHQQGCIKFIEPTVSHQTLLKRQTRDVVVGVASLLQMMCRRSMDMVAQCLEDDTPLPALYRRACRKIPRLPKFTVSWEDMLSIFILCMWISAGVATWGGYVEWAPKERARNWVYTGSFSL